MDNTTIVLSSARAIRHAQLAQSTQTLFLPHTLTMSDFINTICVVPEYKFIDSDTRTLLLLQASDFKNFLKLQIERNFFTFTKNSSYILSFFQELSSELCAIEQLYNADTYAEYEEHITILEELYKRYKALCDEAKLLDTIFLPKLYKLNKSYITSQSKIEIYVDGYLTEFELQLLGEVASLTSLQLHFTAGRFNTKMQEKLQELGFEIEKGYRYFLDMSEKKVLKKEPYKQNTQVACESVSENLLQVAFVKKKIYEYIQKGYDPQKIAVVLPNENAAEMLRKFDTKSNLNFAMGESFTSTQIYKHIQATLNYLTQNSQENFHRLQRYGDGILQLLQPHYYTNIQACDVKEIMRALLEFCHNKTERSIVEKELYHFFKLLPFLQEMTLKSVLNLFMQRLSAQSIDDVRGGKITVMGVLETRGIAFDGVILIDFDEDNVPRRSQKDMFLNTQVRQHAGLPTPNDRENLQRHYYEMLINASKEVSICYVSSANKRGSNFLKQLGIQEQNSYYESDYAQVLFKQHAREKTQEKEIRLEYSFADKSLSATKLKTFLSCKRKYYYNYIANIKDFEIPKDMPKEYEIGSKVHAALKELYTHQQSYHSVQELQKDLYQWLDHYTGKSELENYLMGLQKKRLEPFCVAEVERFDAGWRVQGCESSVKKIYKGMMINGQIDRIDVRDDELMVLDYKTGSYTLYNSKNVTEATDFQLEFYYLLAQEEGKKLSCGFYDLSQNTIVDEVLLEQKLALLESHIADLLSRQEVNFEKCEDTKHCVFCPYKMMCGR